jgi:hypothetical protein
MNQSMSTQARDASLQFEAVKLKMIQDKNGYVLNLSIHPNDVPEALLRAWVGSRYMVVLVKLNDDDTPEVPKDVADGNRAVAMAGQLCRLPEFQMWLHNYLGEDDCVTQLKLMLGIASRSELKTNQHAREQFFQMADAFKADTQGASHGRPDR